MRVGGLVGAGFAGGRRVPWGRRTAPLAGASLAALLIAAQPVAAGDAATTSAVETSRAATAAAMRAAVARSRETAARVTRSVEALRAAQAAARAAAASIHSTVPDGIVSGGLKPVGNPNSTSDGLTAWIGAKAPEESRSGDAVSVTIEQTDSRAILSWETFNVGKNTTLTFDQQGNADWIALNRVVGQIDPATGRRDTSKTPAPSQILGTIKADGTVLVINQNGILFGAGAQVNTHALLASTLEVGRAIDPNSTTPRTIAQRNAEFLASGLLGYNDTSVQDGATFSAQREIVDGTPRNEAQVEGGVIVEAGATLTAGKDGLVLLTGPKVVNAGRIVANDGQVVLQSGREVTLRRSEGSATSVDPNIRGVVATSVRNLGDPDDYVVNTSAGLIEAARGNITLGGFSAVINEGMLYSTTSVSRNGSIVLSAADVKVAANSILAIEADSSTDVIPQDAESVAAFKTSSIFIGNRNGLGDSDYSPAARVEIGRNALIHAPSADVSIGAVAGATAGDDRQGQGQSRVFIDTGATIDVSGIKDVLVPLSRSVLEIGPLKGNELANSPLYRNSFLNGETVYVDPRLSGVRDDGVAWIGSPLIDAATYYAQVGVAASELMTTGGTVTIGAQGFAGNGNAALAADVIVKPGAIIDISGGWVRYEGGKVNVTRLVTADGRLVDIGSADPDEIYAGIYKGYTLDHGRWGTSETWIGGAAANTRNVAEYTEGRDAGALTIKASAIAFDGTVRGEAYTGDRQRLDAVAGSASSSIFGDSRRLQGAASELPSGGFLYFQLLTETTGGADVAIVDGADDVSVSSGLAYGQSVSIGADGELVRGERAAGAYLSDDLRATLTLGDDLLSDSGLSQVSIHTSGRVTVAEGASVTLEAGGVFDVLAGRAITIDGDVSVAGGHIALETFNSRGLSDRLWGGSVFADPDDGDELGDYDITVDGTLSTRGRWVNDYGLTATGGEGGAWLDGGTISLYAAADIAVAYDSDGKRLAVTSYADPEDASAPRKATDISGSIVVHRGATLDVSGGGRVNPDGTIDTSAKGGSLALVSETTYGQLSTTNAGRAGGLSGFRVGGLVFLDSSNNETPYLPLNPDRINAHVEVAEGSILAHGFAGGGTFTLTAPALTFGKAKAANETALDLDFFSTSGFGAFNLTSYKTALLANDFAGGYGGTNAVLATQTLTIGAGETLNLSQAMFPSIFGAKTAADLRGLATGGDLYSVIKPGLAADAYDRKAANLTLGGLLELHVAKGGSLIGDAGAHLTVSKLLNEGRIVLPGGTITQSEVLPLIYGGDGLAHGIRDLADAFSYGADGRIDPDAANALGITDEDGVLLTNGQLAGGHALYLLGLLDEGEGIRLAGGSVTDLSGTIVLNPHAALDRNGATIRDGKVYAGGTIEALASHALTGLPFAANADLLSELSLYEGQRYGLLRTERTITVESGATLDLSGTSGQLDRQLYAGARQGRGYALADVWSEGGTLSAPNGLVIEAGAGIDAHGGAAQALGGTLEVSDLVLTGHVGARGEVNTLTADQIEDAGFDALRVFGSVTGDGDVSLSLRRSFVLESRDYALDPRVDITDDAVRDGFLPRIVSKGGSLTIDAGYVGFGSGLFDTVAAPAESARQGSVTFKAKAIDVTGALLVDGSVGSLRLESAGDLRLIGATPWQALLPSSEEIPTTLRGQIAAAGNLTLVATRVYPATGTSFAITSSAASGSITLGGGKGASAPLSAAASVALQAARIVQGGALYAPFGQITLGGKTAWLGADEETLFAPATQSVTLTAGSLTSISAAGLFIPYGTTTDGEEWYFAPTSSDPLTSAPAGTLRIAGQSIDLAEGATIDLSGGGDVFAFEFVPGTGGSYDVLSRTNTDASTGNDGLQYPDGRQVYAIVPGLSDAEIAAYDPIYGAGYDLASGGAGVGKRVWLDAAPGLAAGWYTLLPAHYALLPGAMRVVERTEASNAIAGTGVARADGSLVVSGRYGDALSGTSSSTIHLFDVTPRETVLTESRYTITDGDSYFGGLDRDGAAPRLGVDAGRLVLDPTARLIVEATVKSRAEAGGRAADIDIGGADITITSGTATAGTAGTIQLSAERLSALGAGSLLIGGIRSELADGTTRIDVTATSIDVTNDAAHPLSAAEVVLVTGAGDDVGASLTLRDGATIRADGTGDTRGDAFVIDGGIAGGYVRVANGGERLVTRLRDADAGPLTGSTVTIGKATLEGDAIALDSSGTLTLSERAAITAGKVALGAGEVSFADKATGLSGLVITPELRARFADATRLTIRSDQGIGFDDGSYDLGNLRLDAPSLFAREGGTVSIDAGDLVLSNETGATAAACGGTISCGRARLEVDAASITIGNGTLRTLGFEAGGVDLTAHEGITGTGEGRFDVGSANLDIATDYIGDGTSGAADITLATTGDLRVTGSGTAAVAGSVAGTALTLIGDRIEVTGATLRATAGTLELQAGSGILLGDGAVVATPGLDKSFGDDVDAVAAAAPGGLLRLTATAGDIELAAGSLVSVGGGKGEAGRLELSAAAGAVHFGGTLDGAGRTGGGEFSLDTKGAVDLAALAASTAATGFTGGFDIRTRTGDLTLAAGEALTADAVRLVADGGLLTIAGRIDTSGVEGGDVELYGLDGVTLAAGSVIDASAEGYGAADSRQARAGDVTLGTTGTGALTIAEGAHVDLSAASTEDRLVAVVRNGETYYQYVAGDLGGSLHLRAPLIEQAGGDTVGVTVASAQSIVGAREITLEGFKTWDLAAIAASGAYKGVTLDETGSTVTLDLTTDLDTAKADGSRARVGGVNFLGDDGEGTLVDFVQNFDVSGAYGQLGGLDGLASFHARPGIDLAFDGNITLASNWNLGAGTVDVTGATAAGLMRSLGGGVSAVVDGAEAALFRDYTHLIYRTDGGAVTGEAPVLDLRAGGDLRLEGTVTDGFFAFSSPVQVVSSGGGGDGSGEPYRFAFQRADTIRDPDFGYYFFSYGYGASAPSTFPYLILGGGGGGGSVSIEMAYSAAANSPALISDVDTAAYMDLFPTLGGETEADTSSYGLVAGADLASADPLAIVEGALGTLTIDAYRQYAGIDGSTGAPVGIDFYFDVSEGDFVQGSPFSLEDSSFVGIDELGEALGASPDTVIDLDLDLSWDQENPESGVNSRLAWASFLDAWQNGTDETLNGLIAEYGDPFVNNDGWLTGAPAVITYWFKAYMEPALALDIPAYFQQAGLASPFGSGGSSGGSGESIEAGLARNLVRTGTGSIAVAASGDVDLYDTSEPLPTYSYGSQTYSEGASAIYTTGRVAQLSLAGVTDPVTGARVTLSGLDLAATDGAYYLDGGGDVNVRAGGSVNSSRATGTKAQQDWLVGAVGSDTALRIAPYATVGGSATGGFGEGIATLGGGDIAIRAGADIVDLSVIAGGSAATAAADTGAGKALVTFGGGDVALSAGRDLLGGRIDIWSGRAGLAVGGDVASAGSYEGFGVRGQLATLENSLALRLFDATIELSALGSVAVQGLAAITADGAATGVALADTVNGYGFMTERSAVGLVANGDIVFANSAGFTAVSDLQLSPSYNAVWPATVSVTSLGGDLGLGGAAGAILMLPGATGNLDLLAGGGIAGASIAMLDADPGLLPGFFSDFALQGAVLGQGLAYRFPAVFSSTSDSERAQQHNTRPTHEGDDEPVRIAAGGDIGGAEGGLILSVAEQARISAGRDIVNMMFFGQNLSESDVTRVTAERDITATTELLAPASGHDGPNLTLASLRPAVQGNTFVIGGPGSFIIEAGRDLGPFLNSAGITAIRNLDGANLYVLDETYAGGIISVGNEWNPYLPETGANVSVLFGVASGADFGSLRDLYVDPAHLADMADYLVTTRAGAEVPVHGIALVDWMKTHHPDRLKTLYGTTNVTVEQAYAAFAGLGILDQRPFLIQVFFDELEAFSDPESATFGESARGYAAIETLFPADRGYTANGEAADDFATIRDLLTAKGYDGTDLAGGATALDALGYTLGLSGSGFEARLVDGAWQKVVDGALVELDDAAAARFDAEVEAALASGGSGLDRITARKATGDLDLRLATVQTARGGDISIFGPGGRVIAGSTVRTSEQVARRAYDGGRLYAGNADGANILSPHASVIQAIPTGLEGVLTLRGGAISSFTDGDFLLNQSRLYTRAGGDITMWSSNGDLNAGQGPKTTANVPPVVVRVSQDLFIEEDRAGSTSGAGIAAYPTEEGDEPNVYLMAPRGTVDAGDAGVRVSGSLFVAAQRVVNADNFQVGGVSVGTPVVAVADVGGISAASAAATAATEAATASGGAAAAAGGGQASDLPSIITVEVLGYGGGGQDCPRGVGPNGECL